MPYPGPTQIQTMVRQIRWEADDVVSVELVAAQPNGLSPWDPGAHLDVVLPNGRIRQYSLCGPASADSYRIGVRRSSTSRGGSEYVHSFLRPGQRILTGEPRNNFGFSDGPSNVFVAGGIGITPILPMVHRAAELGVEWRLFYTGKTLSSMPFRDELCRYGTRVVLHASDDDGRMPMEDVLAVAPDGSDVYACGPAPMVHEIDLLRTEFDTLDISIERFTASTPRTETTNVAHTLHCRRSNVSVTAPPDRTLLSALTAAGVHVPSSCNSGLCGTCEVRVLAGTPDHRDDLLTGPARTRTDVMYVCVSRAQTDELVLDV